MPPGNPEAMVHYEDTIKKRVTQDRIFRYIGSSLQTTLKNVFGNKPIAVWGSRSGEQNRSRYEKMQAGDDILIVEGGIIKLLGKVAEKTINPDLSRELWKNLIGETVEGWDLIYFIANPVEINLSFNDFKRLFGYSPDWSLRGFTSISEDKLTEFYNQYDDLYSILLRIRDGEQILKKIRSEEFVSQDKILGDNFEYLPEELSDHIQMQWKLINLGIKAGTKVWVPRNNQTQISKEYKYDNFEPKFTAGIDTNAKYVEQIDVVWKDEYRIDAAFEIENSTSIYSGLLRFSDLKIVAPNSTYPLFIVAPQDRKNKVMNQVNRPTFKKINFDKEVRFLSYEAINEVVSVNQTLNSRFDTENLYSKSENISV